MARMPFEGNLSGSGENPYFPILGIPHLELIISPWGEVPHSSIGEIPHFNILVMYHNSPYNLYYMGK